MPSHNTGPSPHLPPWRDPQGFATHLTPLQTAILSVTPQQTAACQLLSEGHDADASPMCMLVTPRLCSSPPWPGRKGGLEKGWPCLPPPRSSPGNTSGSSRSARTNVSSTAGGSGRGREGKKQEGNGQAVTRGSMGTGMDTLHCDFLAFSSPSSMSLPAPPCALYLGEGPRVNLRACTQ